MTAPSPVPVVQALLAAFNAGDLPGLRACLADGAVASVTGPDGRPVEMSGADGYVAAVAAMDLPAVDYRVTLTQAPVLVDDGLVLAMAQVRAHRTRGTCTTMRRTWCGWSTAGSPGCGWWRPSPPRATNSGRERSSVPAMLSNGLSVRGSGD